jgi:hypothetical protein
MRTAHGSCARPGRPAGQPLPARVKPEWSCTTSNGTSAARPVRPHPTRARHDQTRTATSRPRPDAPLVAARSPKHSTAPPPPRTTSPRDHARRAPRTVARPPLRSPHTQAAEWRSTAERGPRPAADPGRRQRAAAAAARGAPHADQIHAGRRSQPAAHVLLATAGCLGACYSVSLAGDQLAPQHAVVGASCTTSSQGWRRAAHRYATRRASSSVSHVTGSRSSGSSIAQPPRWSSTRTVLVLIAISEGPLGNRSDRASDPTGLR